MQLLMCPVCQSPLILNHKQWLCENKHSYDIAKQGYVNLHMVQHKHSKSPGDTPEAVQARRRFLMAGYYQPLQQKVVEIIKELNIATALDIGCGEGYYTEQMAKSVQQMVAVDIAKNAVQTAAKTSQQENIIWTVATGAVLPVLQNSIDLCTSLFSPLPKQEMLRVLKAQGYLLVVTPAPKHLYQMRALLFESVKLHEPEKFLSQLQPEFKLIRQETVIAPLDLTQNALQDLICMTPYAWKAKAELRQALEQQSDFKVTAEFQIYVLQYC